MEQDKTIVRIPYPLQKFKQAERCQTTSLFCFCIAPANLFDDSCTDTKEGVDVSTLCERRTFVKATRRAKGKTNER